MIDRFDRQEDWEGEVPLGFGALEDLALGVVADYFCGERTGEVEGLGTECGGHCGWLVEREERDEKKEEKSEVKRKKLPS